MIDFFNALFSPEVPFIRYALIAGLISSLPFGIIGSFVVVKRMTYIAGAVSHTVLGGIGLSLFLSSTFQLDFLDPMVGAAVFALLAALIISFSIIRKIERLDTVIGAVWAIGMSLGLLLMSQTPGYVDPMSYLFGNILMISKGDLIMIALLNILISLISLIFYNQLLVVNFDQEFAKIRGLNTSFFQIMLIMLIALTVLLMISIIGIVMVIALLSIPPAIAGFFTRKFKTMIILASILSAFFMTSGLLASYLLELPTSSFTAALAGLFYLLSLFIFKVIKKA